MSRLIVGFVLAAATAASAQQAPRPSAGGVTVTLALDKSSYATGADEIQAEVKVENTGDKDVEVTVPVFDERSVSFLVHATWNGKVKDFELAVARPDPQVDIRLTPAKAVLAKGKSLTLVHRIPTLMAGSLVIQAAYQNGTERLVTAGARADVTGNGLVAVLDTTSGSIKIDLDPESSPANVANFVSLARRGFYDDMVFHRVTKGSWIQSGCPYGTGFGGPGFAVKTEATPGGQHEPGSVSMAAFQAGHTGSQFFICLAKLPALDGKFPIIGKVDATTMETVTAIGKAETDRTTDRPKVDVKVKKLTIAPK